MWATLGPANQALLVQLTAALMSAETRLTRGSTVSRGRDNNEVVAT
jgi:hypothetical protein